MCDIHNTPEIKSTFSNQEIDLINWSCLQQVDVISRIGRESFRHTKRRGYFRTLLSAIFGSSLSDERKKQKAVDALISDSALFTSTVLRFCHFHRRMNENAGDLTDFELSIKQCEEEIDALMKKINDSCVVYSTSSYNIGALFRVYSINSLIREHVLDQ